MRLKIFTFAALAVSLFSGCESGGSGAVPSRLSFVSLHTIVPDRRGRMKFYNDTFGDATPDGIVAGPDGALWFTDPGNDVIGRVTTKGSYTLQQSIGGANLSSGITVGPDNNLWFTLEGGSIGKMATDGTYTIFQDPSGSDPQGITTGPDGALWYAQSDGTVGRITTGGAITHFTVAGGTAVLQGIVTGPDGNLWVTEDAAESYFSNQVIRVTPKGAHKSFTVGSGPAYICVGPDKALWFAERAANAIGRLTTSGKYTEFPTNYRYAGPSGIAAGRDGAIWFSDFNGRFGIGRVTTKGKMRFYGSPSIDSELRQITPGPDGNMWFTSYLGPEGVGRVTTR